MSFIKRCSAMLLFIVGVYFPLEAQTINKNVNVFLGSSGDHGQLSPGASYPLYQMNILPHTDPQLHTGYEHLAKKVIGFTHNRMEGTGCKGSGGLIMVKPYFGAEYAHKHLTKATEQAGPGFYEISLAEGLQANFAVYQNFGIHEYLFNEGEKGFILDFDYALNNAVVENNMTVTADNMISGSIQAKTTCNVGVYTIHYAIDLGPAKVTPISPNKLDVTIDSTLLKHVIKISFSSVSASNALATLQQNERSNYADIKSKAEDDWEKHLSVITVKGGDVDRKKLFYSLLYRVLQSPYMISEPNGDFKATDGNTYNASSSRYHGWAIWDNYKTQLPLLELLLPTTYQDIIYSIANLYKYGKYDFAGPHEPANSVRTEHAAVVLLDAVNKQYDVPIQEIKEQLTHDTVNFDFSKPDKFLEAAYDMWAMSQLIPSEKKHYLQKVEWYKEHWLKEFKDLTKNDVDRMSARQMYQGTIRQYRWNVPFDVQGLVKLAGGQQTFTDELDDFFDNHYFNRANEPDIQSPTLYYASLKPWKYQSIIHELALDTIVQYYFNDNSRGIDPFIDRVYKNEPKAFIRTMDDDAGAMSSWFVLSAIGLHQPLIGKPIYYINVPFFPEISINNGNNTVGIKVANFADENRYIQSIKLNGVPLDRLWITHEELTDNALIEIEATDKPTSFGIENMYISSLDE